MDVLSEIEKRGGFHTNKHVQYTNKKNIEHGTVVIDAKVLLSGEQKTFKNFCASLADTFFLDTETAPWELGVVGPQTMGAHMTGHIAKEISGIYVPTAIFKIEKSGGKKVPSWESPPNPELKRKKYILWVDDVWRTGSTFELTKPLISWTNNIFPAVLIDRRTPEIVAAQDDKVISLQQVRTFESYLVDECPMCENGILLVDPKRQNQKCVT